MKFLYFGNKETFWKGYNYQQRSVFDDMDERDKITDDELDCIINIRNSVMDCRDLEQDFNSYECALLER